MPHRTCLPTAALLAAALFSASTVHAAAPGVSVETSHFGWKLIDLDPNDGIAAAVSFSPWVNFAASMHSPTWLRDARDDYGATRVDIADGFAKTDLHASGGSTAVGYHGDYSTAQEWFGVGSRGAEFTLTANTAIEFTERVVIDGQTDTFPGASFTGYALITGQLTGVDGMSVDDAYTAYHFAEGAGTRELTIRLESRRAAVTGVVQEGISSRLAITPVPEPSTYAMLLAGIGLVGAMARRRH